MNGTPTSSSTQPPCNPREFEGQSRNRPVKTPLNISLIIPAQASVFFEHWSMVFLTASASTSVSFRFDANALSNCLCFNAACFDSARVHQSGNNVQPHPRCDYSSLVRLSLNTSEKSPEHFNMVSSTSLWNRSFLSPPRA